MKTVKITLMPVVFILLLVISLSFFDTSQKKDVSFQSADLLSSDIDDEYTYVYNRGQQCEYVILISGSDSLSADVDLAKTLKSKITALGGSIQWRVDTSVAESEKEILLGNTDREASRLAAEALSSLPETDALAWCIVELDGKVAYTANSDEAFIRGQVDLLSYINEDCFAVPKGIAKVIILSRTEYEKELESEKEMERLERIEELKKMIGEFEYSDFGDAPTVSMEGSTFGAPTLYPVSGEHPRLNLTSDMLPEILKYMETEEAKYTAFYFWKLANTSYDGKLPPATYHPDGNRIGIFNMDEEGLAIIEAKALAYLLSGDELYAYEAVLAMKNYLTTIDIQYIHSDQCREFGRIIYATAIVYDWCYPVLDEDDKAQFRMAVADIGSSQNQNTDFGNQMEVGFPPKLGTVVSSHSSEHQVLRDYLSIAIAVFDEDPTWYEWVAGMIDNYYVPFREYYFKSGTYPQGVNIYAPHRFDADLWSSWMFLCARGEIPYGDYFKEITRSFFEQKCPDGSLFSTGDGDRLSNTFDFWHHALISAALYGDEVMRANAKALTDGFSGYDGYTLKFSFSQMLILSAAYFEKTDSLGADDLHSGFDPVCYFPSPLGQITARERWNDENAAAVFMRIGERTTANHEHEDAGTFQIYYKGLYTGDSGKYSGYASVHWYYYSTATVAHNGLLISNPSRIGDDPAVPASYFYSGGQRKSSESMDLEHWLAADTYKMGEMSGAAWGYKKDGSTDYAYIGGDISAAYTPSEAAYVGRNMLTYYTGDEDAPMYFIVYDKITSTDESYKKTFLLHTANEPVIDETAKTVVSTENGGRLVLKSLLGGDNIVAVGGVSESGERMDYSINGRQCETFLDGDVMEKWGRVEISPDTNAKTHHLLNFMYVTDSNSTLMLEPELIEAENAKGLVVDKNVFMFADTEGEKNTEAIEFEIGGKGLYRIIVTGLFGGTWDISVDGVSVAHAVSSAEGSVISFYAPAGKVTVAPGKDIVPSNGGRIVYNSFGGKVPDDAPLVYEIGVPVLLPTEIENGCNTFVGWYSSPDYSEESRITELVGTEKGVFNVYAKYAGIIVNEDYEKTVLNTGKGTAEGISYNGKTASEFKTVRDEKNGNTYLRIYSGTADPNVDVATPPAQYLYGGKKLTLSIDIAREESPIMMTICRIRGLQGSSDTFPYFTTTTGGLVMLGGSVAVMELTGDLQTLAVTLDFESGTAAAYNREGNVLGTVGFTPPTVSGCESNEAWLNTISSTVNWWMGNDGVLLIDNFTVYAGDYVPRPIVIPEGYSAIKYEANGGLFVSSPAKIYKEGETTLLEPNIKKGQDDFLGWYTTPDFADGTRIAEITPDMSGDITVYAKWAGKILNVDFEGKDVHFEKEVGIVDGFGYNGTTSPGAFFETRTDATGNTYVYWYRGPNDPQVKYEGKANSFSGRHVITYKISLALTDGETPMEFSFAIRSTRKISETNTSDRFNLFTTDTSGKVRFADGTVIAELSSEHFTEIVVSVDFQNSEVYAYDSVSGSVIASAPFAVDDYVEWLDMMNLPMYVRATGGESIRLDNVSILCAPYGVADDEEILTSLGKIDYVLGGGKFSAPAPSYYKKGEALILPIPTRTDSVFLGWFKDEKFTEPISEITALDTDNFILYAKWKAKVLEISGNAYPDLDVQGKENGAGANNQIGDVNFQTQGYNGCYTTLTDDSGNKYILWKKGTRDPQLIYGGSLSAKAAGNLVVTFKITMAQNGTEPITDILGRMRTSKINGVRQELHLFTVSTDGSVHLSSDKTRFIGRFDTEFKTLGVVADFANEKLLGYNENGELVAECAMKIPSIYSSGVEFYNAINEDLLGFYASGTQETSIRIKSIEAVTGNAYSEIS